MRHFGSRLTLLRISPLLFLVPVTSTPSYANLIENGDFSSPGGGAQSTDLGCDSTFVTGWVNDASVCTGNQVYGGDGWPGIALAPNPDGLYVNFGASDTYGGTLQQTFTTVSGQDYDVNYLLLGMVNSAVEPESMEVQVFDALSNNLLGTEAVNSFENQDWESGPTLTFTATSNSTTLIFTDTTPVGTASIDNWGLDDVSVTPSPEPSTMGMLIISLAILLTFAGRAKSARPRA